jgi:nitroimidazol reductase NimA-like FMN-containing flavoprotein (pyridoxamine 5'-phosphate oxidase superfamily)
MRLKKTVADLVNYERVCRVATAGPGGMPHVVPVCQVVVAGKIYFASAIKGRKVDNLEANPQVALTVDLYSDAWANIKGVMIQGPAKLVRKGPVFRRIRKLLYDKYPLYSERAPLDESDSLIVEVTPASVFTWGID